MYHKPNNRRPFSRGATHSHSNHLGHNKHSKHDNKHNKAKYLDDDASESSSSSGEGGGAIAFDTRGSRNGGGGGYGGGGCGGVEARDLEASLKDLESSLLRSRSSLHNSVATHPVALLHTLDATDGSTAALGVQRSTLSEQGRRRKRLSRRDHTSKHANKHTSGSQSARYASGGQSGGSAPDNHHHHNDLLRSPPPKSSDTPVAKAPVLESGEVSMYGDSSTASASYDLQLSSSSTQPHSRDQPRRRRRRNNSSISNSVNNTSNSTTTRNEEGDRSRTPTRTPVAASSPTTSPTASNDPAHGLRGAPSSPEPVPSPLSRRTRSDSHSRSAGSSHRSPFGTLAVLGDVGGCSDGEGEGGGGGGGGGGLGINVNNTAADTPTTTTPTATTTTTSTTTTTAPAGETASMLDNSTFEGSLSLSSTLNNTMDSTLDFGLEASQALDRALGGSLSSRRHHEHHVSAKTRARMYNRRSKTPPPLHGRARSHSGRGGVAWPQATSRTSSPSLSDDGDRVAAGNSERGGAVLTEDVLLGREKGRRGDRRRCGSTASAASSGSSRGAGTRGGGDVGGQERVRSPNPNPSTQTTSTQLQLTADSSLIQSALGSTNDHNPGTAAHGVSEDVHHLRAPHFSHSAPALGTEASFAPSTTTTTTTNNNNNHGDVKPQKTPSLPHIGEHSGDTTTVIYIDECDALGLTAARERTLSRQPSNGSTASAGSSVGSGGSRSGEGGGGRQRGGGGGGGGASLNPPNLSQPTTPPPLIVPRFYSTSRSRPLSAIEASPTMSPHTHIRADPATARNTLRRLSFTSAATTTTEENEGSVPSVTVTVPADAVTIRSGLVDEIVGMGYARMFVVDAIYEAAYNVRSQLEHLQAKSVGTGHADTSKYEWATHQHRDSIASYIGHSPMVMYFAIAENETIGRSKFKLLEKMICPCGVPPEKGEL